MPRPSNDNYLPYDVALLERELAALLAAYPDLIDDEDLRRDTIEGETSAFAVLGRLVDAAQEAKSISAAIKFRTDELSARRSRFDRRQEALRLLILKLMKAGQIDKAKLPEATVSIGKKAGSVEIIDATALPKAYLRVVSEPNKALIKIALDAGKKVRGAKMSDPGETLTVRVA